MTNTTTITVDGMSVTDGETNILRVDARSGDVCIGTIVKPTRTRSTRPVEYRLVKRNGELFLQGGFHCYEGWIATSIEWEDLPTLEIET